MRNAKVRRAILASVAPVLLAMAWIGCGKQAPPGPNVKALPDSAFRLRWEGNDVPATMAPGSKVKVTVRVSNQGDQVWRDPNTAAATEPGSAIAMSYRWTRENGAEVSGFETRWASPHPVAPGEVAVIPADVTAPKEPGEYFIQFDLLQEFVAWFQYKGAPKLVVHVSVK
jgi:hypothetical protein